MSTYKTLYCGAVLLSFTVAADELPRLGEPLSNTEVEAANYTIMPDGEGLPAGSGSAMQGRGVYQQHCLACHGQNGDGGPNDRLAGGHGSLEGAQPVKTVGSYWPYATTLFDYLRRAMPYATPGNLSNDELYAVTAYLLYLNDIIDEAKVLNAATLPLVKMPNRDGFDLAWPAE